MARKRDDDTVYSPTRCLKCHGDPFGRTIHLLRISDEHIAAGHLKQEFGEEREKDGFIKSELVHRASIMRMYSNQVDENGVLLPIWLAWAKAHAEVYKTQTGWSFRPKYRPNPTPEQVKKNREHYVATGEINPQYLGGMYAKIQPYKAVGSR